MALIRMHVVKAAPSGAALHGDFIIDSPVTSEPEILASLTDGDKGFICWAMTNYPLGFALEPTFRTSLVCIKTSAVFEKIARCQRLWINLGLYFLKYGWNSLDMGTDYF
jgi:hypothetical protein